MKILIKFIIILIVFFKTGNLLSENYLFNVNNILVEKNNNSTNKQLSNFAIKKGFNQLAKRILLEEDFKKISDLNSSSINELVEYYNFSENSEEQPNKLSFNITFDKKKIHNLFYKRSISYADIEDKELFILPIVLSNSDIFIFSNNYFNEKWNLFSEKELIEFIIPSENIEIIQFINQSRNNLSELNLNRLFKEYPNKNAAFVLIEENESIDQKIYLKVRIQKKIISKNITFKKKDINQNQLKEKIISEIKDNLINLIKSQNLINITTPSFINVKFYLDNKNNLVKLNSKIRKIDLIENVFVQEFNKDYIDLKIKYLGKLEKIILKLNNENINLQFKNDQWLMKVL